VGQRIGGGVVREASPDRNEPRFDLDLPYGKQAELQIAEFLDWIADGNGRVEVKHKRYLDHVLYIETHCDKGRTGCYQPSGINVTTAQLWVFVIADTGVHIAIPTELLRIMVADSSSRPVEERDGSCPTRGVLIDFCVLLWTLKRQRARH
jgi:hypothetical protein